MKNTVAYTLAVLMLVGMSVLGSGCRGSSHTRTAFRGDQNVTVIKKRKPKVKGRSKVVKSRSYNRARRLP